MSLERTLSSVLLVLLVAGCRPPDVVAEVGGRRLTVGDVREARRTERTGDVQAAVELLVDKERLAAAAVSRGLGKNETVQARIKAAEREILAQALLDAEVPIPDEKALLHRYESTDAATVRQLELAHVFVAAPAGGDVAVVRRAQNKATTAWARLLGGEAFESVARELSEDGATAEKGGVVGVVREGAIAPEVFAAAAELDENAVSKPIQTPFGFHVLKALKKVHPVKRPFDEVRGALAVQLREEARAALSKRLEVEVKVERYEKAMSALAGGTP
ncbi:MAG: peptidylprolyl isomerase [Myxococcaceae bacterium]|nr:peptidylprolyl isomerase [Myxococcaceae bacterium]